MVLSRRIKNCTTEESTMHNYKKWPKQKVEYSEKNIKIQTKYLVFPNISHNIGRELVFFLGSGENMIFKIIGMSRLSYWILRTGLRIFSSFPCSRLLFRENVFRVFKIGLCPFGLIYCLRQPFRHPYLKECIKVYKSVS